MTYPNTLIFVDLASDDTEAAGKFYAEVMGWTNEGRPDGVYHRMVPGQNFLNPDGNQSEIGNLHLGIFDAKNARPHPKPEGVGPVELATTQAKARIWMLVSDDDSSDAIMDRAIARGATELWRDHFWKEFNGYNAGFRDPWGNEIILWTKAGENPDVPDNFSRE